jgi:recombination protein RecA
MPISPLLKLKNSLTKDYGESSVCFASDIPPYDVVSTGSLSLDYATGIGGVPSNRVIEIAGSEGVGKSSLAMLIIKNFLITYPDKGAMVIDMEHRITTSWVEALIGPELMERVILLWPDSAEQSTDMYTKALESGQICVASYDSIGGSPSQRVTDKSALIGNIGGNALAMTRFAQFASIYSDKYKCLTICINQIRADMAGYNRPITPGGHGLKHAFSLRIFLSRGKDKYNDLINGEDLQVGYSVVARIMKNSLAAPHRVANYAFYNVPCKYGFGIDTLEEILRLGQILGVIGRGGPYYNHLSFPDGKILGREKMIEMVREDTKIRQGLAKEILELLNAGKGVGVTGTFDPDNDSQDNGGLIAPWGPVDLRKEENNANVLLSSSD